MATLLALGDTATLLELGDATSAMAAASSKPRLTDNFLRSISLFSSARSAMGVGEVGVEQPLSSDFLRRGG